METLARTNNFNVTIQCKWLLATGDGRLPLSYIYSLSRMHETGMLSAYNDAINVKGFQLRC